MGSRFPLLFVPLVFWGVGACTQLRAGSPDPNALVSAAPASRAPGPGVSTPPGPSASPSATPSPLPAPTATPLPAVTIVTPNAATDFSQPSVDINVSLGVAPGRSLASAVVTYDGTVLATVASPPPTLTVPAWNPGQANSVAKPPDITPTRSGNHTLTVNATDDQGNVGTASFSFFKPLSVSSYSLAASLPQPLAAGYAFPDNAFPPGYVLPWGSVDGLEANVVPRTKGFSFDPAGRGAWTAIDVTGTGIPRAFYGAALNPNGSFAYVVGGRLGGVDSPNVDVFSPLSKVMEQSPAQLASARHDVTAIFLNGMLYAIGGKQDTASVYDVQAVAVDRSGYPTGNFTDVAKTLNARAGATAAVVNGQIWLFGGGFKPIESYDPVANKWTLLTNAGGQVVSTPSGWSNALMIPVGDRLYFFGGTREDGQAVNQISEFATKTMTWRSLGAMPTIAGLAPEDTPGARMAGAYFNGVFYLIGGVSVPTGKVTKTVIAIQTL